MSFVLFFDIANMADLSSENSVENVIFEHFCVEDEVFGEKVTIDLKPGGRDVEVTDENKREYVE